MGNLEGFDADKHEDTDFEPLPAGTYEACIVASQVKTTKSGTGKYLELQLQILKGPYQNRKLFDRLNVWNSNEKASTIAKGTLSSICRAVGVLTPNDSTDLHNKPLRITVNVRNDEQYGAQNDIKSYKSRHVAGNGSGQAAEAEPEPSSESTPW